MPTDRGKLPLLVYSSGTCHHENCRVWLVLARKFLMMKPMLEYATRASIACEPATQILTENHLIQDFVHCYVYSEVSVTFHQFGLFYTLAFWNNKAMLTSTNLSYIIWSSSQISPDIVILTRCGITWWFDRVWVPLAISSSFLIRSKRLDYIMKWSILG